MSWRLSPLPPDWSRRRLRVLVRDRWRCQIRGPHCIGRANEVDHGDDRDDHRDSNLRAVCKPCHKERSIAQSHAGRASRYRPREPHPGLLPEAPEPYVVGNGRWGVLADSREGVTPQVSRS